MVTRVGKITSRNLELNLPDKRGVENQICWNKARFFEYPPAYLKVHTASGHFLGNGKIRRFGCSLLVSGVARVTHMGYTRPCEDFKVLGRSAFPKKWQDGVWNLRTAGGDADGGK